MTEDKGKSKTIDRHFDNINLDWAIGFVDSDMDCINITAIKYPSPSGTSDAYHYRAHIKWNPNNNWESNITKDAKAWEARQRSTPLQECVMGEDGNYVHEPWERRPNMIRLVDYLKEKGAEDIAKRIIEVYKIDVGK